MPAHQRLGLDDREDLEDRREPSIQLDEEPAIAVRKPGPALHLPSQNDQLLPERRILRLKPALRLERRAQDSQQKADQRDHFASLAEFVAASTRMRFSTHTTWLLYEYGSVSQRRFMPALGAWQASGSPEAVFRSGVMERFGRLRATDGRPNPRNRRCSCQSCGRARLTNNDRWFFVQLYRWFPSIPEVATIIQPETLVRWHRAGFRLFWRWKSWRRDGRPQIRAELRALIRQMSGETRRASTANC